MFRQSLLVVLAVLAISVADNCWASWLSDVTGINIDLAKSLKSIEAPPQTVTIPRPAIAAPQEGATVTVVTDAEKANLLQSVGKVEQDARFNAERNSNVVLTLLIAAILTGLFAGIAGLLKAATTAGVLSLVATAATGANTVLPFRGDADASRTVATQAHVLAIEVGLQRVITEDLYKSYTEKLVALAGYGNGRGEYASTRELDDLLKKLHSP